MDKDGTIKFIIITRSTYLKVYFYNHFRVVRNGRYYYNLSILTSCNFAYHRRKDISGHITILFSILVHLIT
jgi:hypothetical protein